jgi:hypothetical protein
LYEPLDLENEEPADAVSIILLPSTLARIKGAEQGANLEQIHYITDDKYTNMVNIEDPISRAEMTHETVLNITVGEWKALINPAAKESTRMVSPGGSTRRV